jgi:hypothetical protein
MASKQQKYVVVFNVVGGAEGKYYSRGAVVTAEQLGGEAEVKHKLAEGSIRVATE